MIKYIKKLFNSTNEKEILLAEKLKQRVDSEQKAINKLNNDFIKSIELENKKIACNLYLGSYNKNAIKLTDKYDFKQISYANSQYYNNEMQGINLSNPYVNPLLSSSIFYGIFG